jgi:adenylosuccinate synthase
MCLGVAASDDDLQKNEVEYKTVKGWKTSTEHCRKWSELPPNAQEYINIIQEYVPVPGKSTPTIIIMIIIIK